MSHRSLLVLVFIAYCVVNQHARAGVIFSDDFDPIDSGQWTLTSTVGPRGNGIQGFLSGNALHFAGYGTRQATTAAMDLSPGGTITFDWRAGNEDIDGNLYWEDVDPGENGVLEYSTDGTNFFTMANLDLVQFRYMSPTTTWLQFSAAVPAAAESPTTQFRWRHVNHSGWLYDEWAVDNVVVTAQPEPSTMLLLGIGSLAGAWTQRRKVWALRKKKSETDTTA